MIVIDTCVVFHLFNDTILNKKVQQLVSENPQVILPPIWQEEYANILVKFNRKDTLPHHKILESYSNVVDQLAPHEIPTNKKEALRIALEYNISSYDAQFVELAMRHSLWLVTEDYEILKKVKNLTKSAAVPAVIFFE